MYVCGWVSLKYNGRACADLLMLKCLTYLSLYLPLLSIPYHGYQKRVQNKNPSAALTLLLVIMVLCIANYSTATFFLLNK